MSEAQSRVLSGRYVDSVLLMRLAQRLEALPGIEQAAAMMGTDANKKTLAAGRFLTAEGAAAGPNDLVVAVKARDAEAARTALEQIEQLLLAHRESESPLHETHTLEQALTANPHLNLALVSVPGEHVGGEVRRALERGLHVMIFSSNVLLDDEVALKRLANEKGLLCMGPDCGTAIIGGVGLAFANVVRRGPIGVVGASGTGIQAVTSLLDRLGVGVSHAIGCGSRDLSAEVGAATALQGLTSLEADDATTAILVISKPPAPSVAALLRRRASQLTKPVVLCFLGESEGPQTLAEAAIEAARAAGRPASLADFALATETPPAGTTPVPPQQPYLRGLFAGGTLAYEAQLILRSRGLDVYSNAPLPGGRTLEDVNQSRGHTILDLGSEELTQGRPHPMIDSRLRGERLLQEAADPEVGVILLDFVLGYGAAGDPAGDLVGPISAAFSLARAAGRELRIVASVLGTDRDPQHLPTQEDTLRRAGVLLAPTSAQAAELAASLLPDAAAAPQPAAREEVGV